MNAVYTKLKDGSWGIRVHGCASIGQKITVTKRSGESRTERVSKVLWTGKAHDGQEASLVTIERRQRMGAGHGAAPSVAGYSSYCTGNDSCRCYDCAS